MLVGDIEVPDGALEAALKASGKRLIEQNEFEKAMGAAADWAKFRKVTGDQRSVEDIEKLIRQAEENERKNKTQAELLTQEVQRLDKALKEKDGEIYRAKREMKSREIKDYFDEAQAKNNMRVIEPILAPFREKFLDLDESQLTPEALKAQVNQALKQAQELQVGELARLGLAGITQSTSGPSFAPGMTTIQQGPVPGVQAGNESDLFDIMKQTAANPLGAALGIPRPQGPTRS